MGDAEGGTPRDVSEAEQRERRLAALRTLAEQATVVEPGTASEEVAPETTGRSRLRGSARPRRRRLVLCAALVAVLLVAGVGVYQLTRPKSTPAPTIPAALTIDLAKDHLAC